MEGKTLILSVVLMSLFMAQIQVNAWAICCPDADARDTYNFCRMKSPEKSCARVSGCVIAYGTCPYGYTKDILENTGDSVDEYCKLGCVSSVCGALTILQKSDGSEIVKEAVEKCAIACSTVCNKGSKNGVEIA